MGIFIVHHEDKGVDYFIPWDNGKKQPWNETARFFNIEQLREWFLKNRPGDVGSLPSWVKLCMQHGVNHQAKIMTPERVFGKVRIEDGGKLTSEVAFIRYAPKSDAPAPEPKETRANAKKSRSSLTGNKAQKETQSGGEPAIDEAKKKSSEE